MFVNSANRFSRKTANCCSWVSGGAATGCCCCLFSGDRLSREFLLGGVLGLLEAWRLDWARLPDLDLDRRLAGDRLPDRDLLLGVLDLLLWLRDLRLRDLRPRDLRLRDLRLRDLRLRDPRLRDLLRWLRDLLLRDRLLCGERGGAGVFDLATPLSGELDHLRAPSGLLPPLSPPLFTGDLLGGVLTGGGGGGVYLEGER